MQISLFDGSQKFKLNKPIRLIELFGGYGSQHFSLSYLGLKFEQWKLCEWAIKSIQAYKDAHFENDNTDYSKGLTKGQIEDWLFNKGISSNYNEPMGKDQIKRLGEFKIRQIYNNIKATHNLVNIQQVHSTDLEIVDVDKYCYIMTYSFPCQDLSKAGLGKGMEKGSGTRSGMLWEVERILNECENLPQVLLMENVPDVIGSKNIAHFSKWLEKLESLGYHCYWKVLNAKDYGIPQNRERCFMVSILGDYYYDFPKKIQLENKLKDILENEVDEKYYLSSKAIEGKVSTNFQTSKLEFSIPNNGIVPTLCARDYKDPKCVIESDKDFVEIKGRKYPVSKNAETNLKTKLCDKLINEGLAKENDVIRHSYTNNRLKSYYASNKENHDCSPTLDTRCDCLGIVVKTNNKRLKNLVEKTKFGKETLALDCFNQSVHSDCVQTIKTNIDSGNMTAVYNDFRIRKFTPKECFRLMGVKDEDFEKIAKNQSNASLYHLAGDSIVVNVLMAIFREML
jgi:DNA (cytosine-5)-methyltransferase 1